MFMSMTAQDSYVRHACRTHEKNYSRSRRPPPLWLVLDCIYLCQYVGYGTTRSRQPESRTCGRTLFNGAGAELSTVRHLMYYVVLRLGIAIPRTDRYVLVVMFLTYKVQLSFVFSLNNFYGSLTPIWEKK
jgi:hypothetical protein